MESKILSKKDLNQMALDSLLLQHNFNYERYQGTGFGAAMAPTLAKIYGDDKEALAKALVDHSQFFNSSPAIVPFLMGIIASMEEDRLPREAIAAVKNSLFPPMAGIGDAIVWFTALPLAAGVGASLCQDGSVFGVIVYSLILLAANALKWPCAHLGYTMGASALEVIGEKIRKITTAASIVGVMVLGAMVASYVSFSFDVQIPLAEGFMFDLQADFFDNVFPNFMPALITAIIYYLLKKKNTKPIALIVGIMVLCVIAAYLHIV